MEEKQERFLPIGSVVLLKGGTKKAMITGFCSISADDKNKIYDYTGCIYPEGYLDFEQICLFDHEQIEKVFHIGYIDEEEKQFKAELKEVVTKIDNGEESINDYVYNDSDEDIEEESPLIIPSIPEDDENEEEYEDNDNDDLEYL